MRRVRFLVDVVLVAFAVAVVLAAQPASAYADGIGFGPQAGELYPFGDYLLLYVPMCLVGAAAVLFGILILIRMARRNRPKPADLSKTSDGRS